MLFSCNKNHEAEKAAFAASIEQLEGQCDTNTILNPANGQIKWLSGDRIVIANGKGETSVFDLYSGAGTIHGLFNTSDEFGLTVPFKAAYPSSAVINGNKVSFDLPSTQNLGMNVGSFANGANPMIACSDNENLFFKNLCGGLGIRLQGDNVHIDCIRITSCDESEKLNGAFEVNDCTIDEPVLVPADGNTGTNVITLTCDVILSADTVSEFFVVLPVGALAQGFMVEVLNGEEVLVAEEMDSGLAEVVRNGIKCLNPIDIQGEPSYYQVYGSTNPYDQIIALIYTQDHDSIMVYGDKDANAMPIGIRELVVHQHDEEGRMVIEFDEQNRPIDFLVPNGVRMMLEWLDESSAALTLIYLPTGEQLNTIVYFDESRQERIYNSLNTRRGDASMTINNNPKPRIENENKVLHYDSRSIEGSLFGYACGGMQSWGDYYVNVFRDYGSHYSFIGRLPCYHVVANRYRYAIPEGYFSHHYINAYDICDAIVNFLGYTCTALEGQTMPAICVSIATGLGYAAAIQPEAYAAFYMVCEIVVRGLNYYCMTAGNSPGPGGPTIGDRFCELFRGIEHSWSNPIYLSPYVKALPYDVMGQGAHYNGVGTPNPIYVDSGGDPSIDEIELQPAAPLDHQDYDAIAHCSCLQGGSRITMSIVGTDDYSDSKTIYLSTDNEHVDATLHVPGAETGVRDVITVVVTLPDGSTLPPQTAHLVFH